MEISILLAAVAAVVGAVSASSLQKKEQSWQTDMQNQQNQFNIEQQNKQNDYNNPSEQMKRMLGAGFSPAGAASALGVGEQSSPVVSSQMPSVNSVAPTISQLIASTGANTMQYWQNKKLQAEVENLNAQTGWIPKLNDNTIRLGQAQIKSLNAAAGLSEAQTKQVVDMLPLLKGKTEMEIDQIEETINKTKGEIDKLKEESKLLAWKNVMRDQFGFDPDASDTGVLIGLLLNGKADNVIAQLFETAKSLISPTTWLPHLGPGFGRW